MKGLKPSFLLFLTFLLSFSLSAQDWKKSAKDAESLYNQGKFLEAGDKYFEAWQGKQKKLDYAYMAGTCYFLAKQYTKAVQAYAPVKDMNDTYDQVGFNYARALKSTGAYDEAGREFVYFINSYKGSDFAQVSQVVQNEILGCEMALKMDDNPDGPTISHLGEGVNTPELEYAPIPYTDDILYFSSTMEGSSKIYRAQRKGDVWNRSNIEVKIFDNTEKKHFGNGAFSPDRERFYFTQCEEVNSFENRCDLYYVEGTGTGGWTEPIKLPEYINDPKATTTHPSIAHVDGVEFLYFSTDREGGKGGRDIWFVSRSLESDSEDFTFPKNLGSKINTPGDEVTPFYDNERKVLYFSSNGQVNIGGLDILKSEGHQFDWKKPENIGAPYNSPADDWFFIYESNPSEGFLVSNRKHGMEKLSTAHEDIFSFSEGTSELVVAGRLTDGSEALSDVSLTLLEVAGNGQKRIITKKVLSETFRLAIIEGKTYMIQAEKPGHATEVMEFTVSPGTGSITRNIVLKKTGGVADVPKPVITRPEPQKPVVNVPKPNAENVSAQPDTNPISEPSSRPVETPKPTYDPPAVTESKPMKPAVETPDPVVETPKPTVEAPKPVVDPKPVPETVYDPPKPTYEPPKPTPKPSIEPEKPVYTETTRPVYTEPEKPVYTEPSRQPDTRISDYPNFGGNSSSGTYTEPSSSDSSSGGHSSSSSSDYPSTSFASGTYYKVQMEAMKSFNESKYSGFYDLGSVEGERTEDGRYVRVLVGNFYSRDEAVNAREEIRSRGYDRAYIVEYRDGVRKRIKVFQ